MLSVFILAKKTPSLQECWDKLDTII